MTLTFLVTILFSPPSLAEEALSPALVTLQQQVPEEYERRRLLQPRPTRAGHLRFVGSELSDPMWAPLYIDRYQNGSESTEVRRALLHLVYRSLREVPDTITDEYTEEPAILRADIIELGAYNPILLKQSLNDKSPLVRGALARKTGTTEELSTDIIIQLLQDQDEKVQMDAARAAYRRDCQQAVPLLIPLSTQQQNATLALRSLYAISKLDRDQAISIITKHGLTKSPHQNLAIFARNLLSQ